MWRATIKGLLAHKVRLALTALAIVLGVGFVSGTYILTDTMGRAFDDLFRQVTKGVAVQVSGVPKFKGTGPAAQTAGPAERVPESLIATIRGVPGVRAAEGGLSGYAQLVTKDGKAVTTGGAPTLGVSATRDPGLSSVTVRSGRAPDRPGEIGVDARTAQKFGFSVGDTVTVLLEGPSTRATIVGIFGFGSADNLGGATLVAFDPKTAQIALNGRGTWDVIDVAAAPGVDPKDLRARIQRVLPKGFQAKTGTEAAADASGDIKEGLSFFNIALLVFAAVALFVGAFTIFNTFSILVAQRTRELGLLRALGASVQQVRRSVIAEALIVGVVASGAGLVFGFVVALGIQGLLRGFGIVLPSTATVLLPRTIVAALGVGIGTTVVSSIMPAVRAARVPPIAAMGDVWAAEYSGSRRRFVIGAVITVLGVGALALGLIGGRGASAVGTGAAAVFLGVAVLSPLLARPIARALGSPLPTISGLAGKLGRENAIRNPGRTASTAAALMIGLGLVSFVSVFSASVKASLNDTLLRTLRADYAVIPSTLNGQSMISRDVAARLREDGSFSSVVEFRQGSFGLDGGTQFLTAADPAQLPHVQNVEMSAGSVSALGDGDVLVHKPAADSHRWKVGDIVKVVFARSGPQNLRIAGIFEKSALQSEFLVTLTTFERSFVTQLDALVLLKTAPGVSQAHAKAAADRIIAEFPNTKVQDQAQLRATQAKQLDQLLGLITALLGLSILIALFGIVNTLALSIFERTREIGLLRAVGMARRQVRTMIRWEAVLVAVFGALLGMAVGIFFGWAMVRALGKQGVTMLSIPAGQLGTYIALAGLAGVMAAAGPARRAARLNVLDAIASE